MLHFPIQPSQISLTGSESDEIEGYGHPSLIPDLVVVAFVVSELAWC